MKQIYLYKKITLISAICSLLLSFGSCNSNIDLEPEGIITAPNYFKSVEDYEKALNSVYNRVNYGSYGFWFDACTDNGIVTHSWNRGYDIGRGIGNTSSSFPLNKWNDGYVSLQQATNIVSNIDAYDWSGGENDTQRLKILGEARTLRSYYMLDLLCTFGKIMFYQEVPQTVAESKNVKQVTDIKEVFDFILSDLEQAIAGLPDTPANKSKIGKEAARILRARAAAYAAGYLKDKSYFKITLSETEALMKNKRNLADFGKLFATGNQDLAEVVFVKSYSEDSKNSWGNWYNNSLGGYCVTTPVKALVDAYEYVGAANPNLPYLHKDPRFYETIYAPGTVVRGKYYNTIPENTIEKNGKVYFDPNKDYGAFQDKEVLVGDALGEAGGGEWNKTSTGFTYKKYNSESETWSTWNSFVIFRFAEVYLLRAEALVETGGSEQEAKQLIQVIRDRAGNTNSIEQMVTQKYGSLLNLIRNERRVELAHEGLRLFDLRRWGILLEEMNKPIQGIEYRDFKGPTPTPKIYTPAVRENYTQRDYWWPIPQAEIDLNEGRIIQNDGWK